MDYETKQALAMLADELLQTQKQLEVMAGIVKQTAVQLQMVMKACGVSTTAEGDVTTDAEAAFHSGDDEN